MSALNCSSAISITLHIEQLCSPASILFSADPCFFAHLIVARRHVLEDCLRRCARLRHTLLKALRQSRVEPSNNVVLKT